LIAKIPTEGHRRLTSSLGVESVKARGMSHGAVHAFETREHVMNADELLAAVVSFDRSGDAKGLVALAEARAAERFRENQLRLLQIEDISDADLREAGRKPKSAREELRGSADFILRRVFAVGTVSDLKKLPPSELWARALSTRYAGLPTGLFDEIRVVGVLGVSEDRAYGVVVKSAFGFGPKESEVPGVVSPSAMTLVRRGGEWRCWLDAGLRIDARRAFAPDEYETRRRAR
jgi:hypothetical protein